MPRSLSHQPSCPHLCLLPLRRLVDTHIKQHLQLCHEWTPRHWGPLCVLLSTVSCNHLSPLSSAPCNSGKFSHLKMHAAQSFVWKPTLLIKEKGFFYCCGYILDSWLITFLLPPQESRHDKEKSEKKEKRESTGAKEDKKQYPLMATNWATVELHSLELALWCRTGEAFWSSKREVWWQA